MIRAALILTLLAIPALARDNGQWANSPNKAWFDSLSNQNSTPCCSYADGLQIDGPDWQQTSDPAYPYMVSLKGEWIMVNKEAVVSATNKVGYAVVWPVYVDGQPTVIRCFLPGVQL